VKKRRSTQWGMTLMETMVVLMVAGLLLAVLSVALYDIFGARLSQATGQISSVCRYGYDQATLLGKIHRLAIDHDEGTYWLEEVDFPKECGLVPDTQADPDAKKEKPKEEGSEAPGTGKAVVDMSVKKEKLPNGIKFDGLLTNRLGEIVTEGVEYVHFFPDGTAEKAFLWVSDGQEIWTIEVKALQGTGLVHKVNLEEREFGKR